MSDCTLASFVELDEIDRIGENTVEFALGEAAVFKSSSSNETFLDRFMGWLQDPCRSSTERVKSFDLLDESLIWKANTNKIDISIHQFKFKLTKFESRIYTHLRAMI